MNSEYKKAHKPTKKSKFHQGYYVPINPEKYVGNPGEIIYRSSYEYKFCLYCDTTPGVIKWASEPFSIKYFDPIDKKTRQYNIDFYIRIQEGDKTNDYLIEVKPKNKLVPPVHKGKTYLSIKKYNQALREYIIIMAKKQYAELYAESMGYKFMFVTEDFLYEKS